MIREIFSFAFSFCVKINYWVENFGMSKIYEVSSFPFVLFSLSYCYIAGNILGILYPAVRTVYYFQFFEVVRLANHLKVTVK